MNHLLLKISLIAFISLLSISNSYAQPDCYMPMRSLDLSVKSNNKDLCQKKQLKPAPLQDPIENKDAAEGSFIEMDAYFVYPHIENKEEEPTADGLGANVNVEF